MSATRLRSLLTSIGTTVIDAGLFALCTVVLSAALLPVARWSCGAAGAVANFLLNRHWAFAARRRRPPRPQVVRYALTAALSLTLATALWCGLRSLLAWDPRMLHLLSMALVWPAVTFPLLRYWVFPPEPAPVPAPAPAPVPVPGGALHRLPPGSGIRGSGIGAR